jgi:hypothetical protein
MFRRRLGYCVRQQHRPDFVIQEAGDVFVDIRSHTFHSYMGGF